MTAPLDLDALDKMAEAATWPWEAAMHLRVPIYGGAYEVDANGTVWSMTSNWRGAGRRALVADFGEDGYLRVRLILDGRRVRKQVHRLICEAFHGPCPAGMQTRHLDGSKTNNRPTNLAWGTAAENADDREAHGHTARGERSGTAQLTLVQVEGIRGAIGTQRQLAALYGVSQRTIGRIRRGEQWT
jgi:hypothetical protein